MRKLGVMRKLGRLFIIKNRLEAFAIIYALALGGAERGKHYLDSFPGFGGRMLFVAAMVAVFMAGAKILDALTFERAQARDTEPKA
jgi:predicted outer membrane lipoprotein